MKYPYTFKWLGIYFLLLILGSLSAMLIEALGFLGGPLYIIPASLYIGSFVALYASFQFYRDGE